MNYEELGLKIGIEIHQQLDTHKLFCNCPSYIRDDKPDVIVKRKLRAAAGETGEIDVAAKHEMEKSKTFIYHAYNGTTCLVELDDEPPGPLNQEALQIALEISLLLNAKTVDEIQVMRKTVVDGSNPSGFQRTMLIGTDGYIDTSEGRIGIPIVCLEEEAAQIKERTKEHDVYNLSRLGIPLVEIGTDPDIKTPQGAKEAAEKIGMVLRSTGKVKRGLGTIRQDVNLSIKNGARTEIKGFQDLKSIPKVIENEIERQFSLIKQGKKVKAEVRKAEPDLKTSFLRPMPGSARMYPETDISIVKPDISKIKLPELIFDKAEKYEKLGLGKDLAKLVSKSDKAVLFERFTKFKNIKPAFIAEALLPKLREIKRKHGVDTDKITEKHFEDVFGLLDKNKIAKDAVEKILTEIAKGKKPDYKDYELLSDKDLEKEIKKIIAENKKVPLNALIGKAMGKLRGRADGRKVVEMLKKLS